MQDPVNPWPRSRQACLAEWQAGGKIPVPIRKGGVLNMRLERLFECTAVNGLPLDLLIEARASKRAPPKRFGVIFSAHRPGNDYPLPILWLDNGQGTWLEQGEN